MLTLLAKLPICWPNVWQIYVDAALLWNFWRCLWYHFCRLTYISRFVQLYRCELLCFFRVKSAKFSRMYLLSGDDSGTCNPYWYSINPSMPPHIKTAEQQTIIQQYWIRWLVHWPLMDGLIHLVQRGGAWTCCGPVQSLPRCTKCNSPPINGQCTNFILFDVALQLLLDSKVFIVDNLVKTGHLVILIGNGRHGLKLVYCMSIALSFTCVPHSTDLSLSDMMQVSWR